MAQSRFEQAEAEYWHLRGQLTAGRISQQQFEAALEQLVFQDAHGRSWMLGVDSGKWYMHNGQAWIESLPQTAGDRAATSSPVPLPPTGTHRSRSLLLPAAGCICSLCIISILGVVGAFATGLVRIAPVNMARATLPSGAGHFSLSSTSGFQTPTLALQSFPVPTSTFAAVPNPIVARTETFTPIRTATIEPTKSLVTVPATATPVVAPDVYVTSLRLEPSAPSRREDVAFYPTFLNATNAEQSRRWLAYIYRPDSYRHAFGETPKSTTLFPVGATEQKAAGVWRLTGGGECENFVVRVAWINEDNQPVAFARQDGQVYELPFTVCP